MIIVRTPFRVSLFGGGTDYPRWYEQHGGESIGFAIDKFCWISLRKLPPFFPYRHRIVYSQIELVSEPSEIRHPVVRAALKAHGAAVGIELHHDGDLPARSGLGSSSSFTVGLLHALRLFKGHAASPRSLAMEAIHIERDELRENVGSQDQVWASHGGLNHLTFHRDGAFDVRPLLIPTLRRHELNAHLMLVFTGFSRSASEIAGQQLANFEAREPVLRRMQQMVHDAGSIIEGQGGLAPLGDLLHEGWMLKRSLADAVSTPEIDEIYAAARSAGALGGKLLGAGGGGFMLFFVPPGAHIAVKEKLAPLVNVDFRLGAEGSRAMLYEPEGL